MTIITYNKEGVVTEHPDDKWARARVAFTCKLPMNRRGRFWPKVCGLPHLQNCSSRWTPPAGTRCGPPAKSSFDGCIDLYPSSPFFIEAVPLGVAKDGSLAALLEHMGLGRENLMACGDGLNDRSMIEYAGVGVAMQNAEEPVKAVADYVTAADNDHDGVAEAVEKFILK